MKKILTISNMYPSLKAPHYGVFVKESVQILRKKGFLVDTVVLKKPFGAIEKIFGYSLFYMKILLKLIFNKYDFVYIHFISLSSIPVIFASKLGVRMKIVANIHGNDLIPDEPKDIKRLKWSYHLIKLSHKVIVPSSYFKEELVKLELIDSKDIIVYPSSGVDTDVFKCKEQKPFNFKKAKVGFVSRIEKNKGWDIFLDMVNQVSVRHPNWEFSMVGNGKEEAVRDTKAENLNIISKIRFYDFMNQEELNDYFNTLDIFIFPTYRKSESLGLVGLEAMACGRLIVGPDSLGPASYISDNRNGFTFKVAQTDSLIRTIEKISKLPEKKQIEISNKAIKTAERYSRKNTESILIKIFSGDNE